MPGWGFARFDTLPMEVQLLIWEALMEAYDPYSSDELRLRSSEGVVHPVLHVNRASRETGLSRYQLSFGAVDGRTQYFDFGRDALHPPQACFRSVGGLSGWKTIQPLMQTLLKFRI